jgi:hypothetical protein
MKDSNIMQLTASDIEKYQGQWAAHKKMVDVKRAIKYEPEGSRYVGRLNLHTAQW